jgi:hypothetical protein
MRRRLGLLGAGAVLGFVLRRQLVALLTATTGTWVGSPPSPPPASAEVDR